MTTAIAASNCRTARLPMFIVLMIILGSVRHSAAENAGSPLSPSAGSATAASTLQSARRL
eukprot:CAMPEP_0118936710 /NCGR_PEP_ID=MMETSP1169-20130426/20105_1 /TAXON_ID=36882 /ORGANISM="Pyramimonas obovata, Strain CCMP722" /LENGTH=59 /DNA_ID=CAMNT_0006880065 /DNA_START=310 /DNA_END=486 /DNA_ORIENTATION=+